MVALSIIKETKENERRVAASPETVKKFTDLGFKVSVECGAGESSGFTDEAYKEAGATIENDTSKILKADIIAGVQPEFEASDLAVMKKDAVLVGMFDPFSNKGKIETISESGATLFSMEFIPRITRAQNMDVLSSQSNLAGYKSVIDAFNNLEKVIPMMMTAAGTIKPAKVLVLGAGVAGLQAIATAKRMGAVVSAFDVRPVVKEQVESLGATFIEVESEETESAETSGGYAKEMSDEYKKKQEELIFETAKEQDVIITTALIPGRPAPVLIPEKIVKAMAPGSVIVDMAVTAGGNCPLSELNQTVIKHGVKIIGYENVPSRVAPDASALYSRNIFNFVSTLIDKEDKKLSINEEDEIISGCMVAGGGKIVNKAILESLGKSKTTKKKDAPVKDAPKKVTTAKPHVKKKTKTATKKVARKKKSE